MMEKSKYRLLYFLFTAFLLIRCNTHSSIKLNKAVIDNICYEATLLSKDLMEHDDTIEIADLIYLKFTIYENKENVRIQEVFKQANYNNLLFYINTKISGDFKILQDEKEYSPVQVYFENNNRIANKLVFMLAFEKTGIEHFEDLSLKFDDNIFDNGIIKLKLNTI